MPMRSCLTLLAGVLLTMPLAHAADDTDALSLPGAGPAEPVAAKPLKLFLEAAVGRIERRHGLDAVDARRAAVDLRYNARLSDQWQWAVSDRFDSIHEPPAGQRAARNSLRELYLAWQDEAGASAVELGRINLRNGPAYGYNPTDFFRWGALRTVTTADPVALRENRLGTYMVRGSHALGDGSLGLALAPKLDDDPSDRSISFDAGATNSSDRALVSYGRRFSERLNAQVLLLAERGHGSQVGANFSALVGDSIVAFGEWSNGRGPSLFDRATGVPGPERRVNRVAAGLTYTLPSKLSLTAEAEYNGAGLDRSQQLALLAAGPVAYQRHLDLVQSSMELGSRRAWLLYASQKDLGIKNFDMTGFVRINAVDHSRLAWLEGRYHWDRVDVALQWQRSSGRATSEFGAQPYRQVVQLVGAWYF